jgi:hypothetical protein
MIELAPDGNYLKGWGGDLIADAHRMTVDAAGRILAVDRDMHEVIICSPDGERLGGLGRRGVPLAPFNHPTDVHVSAWGEIYVSDGYAASRVHRFDAAGNLIRKLGQPRSGRWSVRLAACDLDLCGRPRRRGRPQPEPGAGIRPRGQAPRKLGRVLPARGHLWR